MQKRPLWRGVVVFQKDLYSSIGQVMEVGKSRVLNPNLFTEMLL